ncbi:SDR family NAD(P)-dependent oxidoreductase [Pedococcus sp. NPDC057267]|uniref:SDR family NAD(P)-dependent oxidoreductase n=1 Tax=Pedococcus sp. NPDC057267 TaxID=3346077 RepID=UPI00363F6E0B
MTTTTDTAPDAPTGRTPTTVLVTGANKGLGLETSHRLAELGWTVWMAARDRERGETAAREVSAAHPDAAVRFVELDVTDDDSVAKAYEVVSGSGTGLDVLVNNAGVIGGGRPTLETTPADLLPVLDVNLLGPARVTHAFLPLLTASRRPRLVMVSSGLGSIQLVNDPSRTESRVPGLAYQSSKAALNMVTTLYAKALPDVRVCAVDPGYTATDLNGHSGPQTVREGTDAIVTAAAADVVPGQHFDRYGVSPA